MSDRHYRVFRYSTEDPQQGAPGTGVTIRDGFSNDWAATRFEEGYVAALIDVGWQQEEEHILVNPAGEAWIFTYESYLVMMCSDCGGYVPNWMMDRNDQPWCANCADRALFEGIGARMDAMWKEFGPYITRWPLDWETCDVDAVVAVCDEIVYG